MKRRNFLSLSAAGIGLAGLGPGGSVAGGRLYGAPLYESNPDRMLGENRLRLALSRIEMPVEAWAPLINMSRLWNAVLQDDSTRKAFRRSPRKFLARNGVPLAALAVAWVCRQDAVTSAIVGAKRADQVLQNVQALDWLERDDVFEQIDRIVASFRI